MAPTAQRGFTAIILTALSASAALAGVTNTDGDHDNQRSLLYADVTSTDLGCFKDSKTSRLLRPGLVSEDMTTMMCRDYCLGRGTYTYYALQYGNECWCGHGGTEYDALGKSEKCNTKCAGDSSDTCGGFYTFNLYSYDTSPEPTNYLGCYADDKHDRILDRKLVDNKMTEEMCKDTCGSDSKNAFFGLQYGKECWCGDASSDYSRHGISDACYYRCKGERRTLCGGRDAMSVYSMGDVAPTPTPEPTSTQKPAATPEPTATAEPTATPVPTATATPTTAGSVLVDLQPCILSPAEITEATGGPYILNQFFQGYWAATQVVLIAPGDDLMTAMTTPGDANHALCNSVYVAIVPTAAQYTALQAYSAMFKVRVVYMSTSASSADLTVQARLGIQELYVGGDIQTPSFMAFTGDGAATARVLNSAVKTNPVGAGLFTKPVRVSAPADPSLGTATVIAEYLDASSVPVVSETFPSAAIMTWVGVNGAEEMHIFVDVGWFDIGSWAWVHHMVEWATKGVFMGERRFYLAPVVDDLFLTTSEFLYGGTDDEGVVTNEGTRYRLSGAEYVAFKEFQDSINSQYESSIKTEFSLNGAGILEEVSSVYLPPYEDTLKNVKGVKMTPPGLQPLVHDPNYLTDTVPLLAVEYETGGWDADELLQAVLAEPDAFYQQSHTLIHLTRDELQQSDCDVEDGGNVAITKILGMYSWPTYNQRSMVSPGISGLFNANCLQSGDNNLMKCYPGDNTFDGVQTTVSLLSSVSPYHSIFTTVDTNGYDGMQIVPRYASFVYFNCVSGACLVNENEYIRRVVCGCSELDPSLDRGTCETTANGCNSNADISSFGSVEEIFVREETATTRQILSGRRDKYMFHQANLVPTDDLDGSDKSLLEYWYERVMASISSYITFPVTSTKFDDLCENFKDHEELDSSGAVVTATVAPDGSITGMALSYADAAGVVPVTVPVAPSAPIILGGLTPYETETYGSDITYYFATTTDAQPTPAPQVTISSIVP